MHFYSHTVDTAPQESLVPECAQRYLATQALSCPGTTMETRTNQNLLSQCNNSFYEHQLMQTNHFVSGCSIHYKRELKLMIN